ncbi:MAG TPA: hypothetical protein VFN53_08975 [Acidobacteriaceae bacterium]|nr:hypothetical protein [Acidobacteriaceae bacterium]
MKLNAAVCAALLLGIGLVTGQAKGQAPNRTEITPPASTVVSALWKGATRPPDISASELNVRVENKPAKVDGWLPLQGKDAAMQLVILIDDSARSKFGLQIPSLKKFITTLPASTEVAIAYMGNGSASMAQAMTADHELAAKSLRLTTGIPDISGSPYLVLSSLAKNWPSQRKTNRRVVFMITNGEDPYYTSSDMEDPYVASAIADCQRARMLVYSIYFRNRGAGGANDLSTLYGQSYLLRVSNETGGISYTEGLISPVSFDPFLKKFKEALETQYLMTVDTNGYGLQRLQVSTKQHHVKLAAPSRIDLGGKHR